MRGSSWFVTGCIFLGACAGKFGSTEERLAPTPSPRPAYGKTVSLAKEPPPLSGGTLIVSRDRALAIAADPDRDRVSIVHLGTGAVDTIALSPGDEPGRAIEDDAGRVHVVLRRAGAVATVDLATKKLLTRRAVCATPRGIAFASARLFVTCASGELLGLEGDAEPKVLARLAPDLRDVVVHGSELYVSHFRAATVSVVGFDGSAYGNLPLAAAPMTSSKWSGAVPDVAWRMVAFTDGRVAVVHQRARQPGESPISTNAGGYSEPAQTSPEGKPCGLGIVHSAVSLLSAGGGIATLPPISDAVLPIDLAVDARTNLAVVAAGNGHTKELAQVFLFDAEREAFGAQCLHASVAISVPGQPIAAAFADDVLVVQTREPASLRRYSLAGELLGAIELGGESREDTGHAIFHSNAGGFIACASCHPEGSDDGHVWSFDAMGPRRTQNLRGGIVGTAPFHWDGTLVDLHSLMGEVFSKRMSGAKLAGDQVDALSKWIDRIPYLPAPKPVDAAAAARGDALFHETRLDCVRCHSGPKLTNNQTVDVGTGPMQVPSLRGLKFRAPFMHDGCAPNLAARFGPCGGNAHGNTADLTPTQLADLVAYLESL